MKWSSPAQRRTLEEAPSAPTIQRVENILAWSVNRMLPSIPVMGVDHNISTPVRRGLLDEMSMKQRPPEAHAVAVWELGRDGMAFAVEADAAETRSLLRRAGRFRFDCAAAMESGMSPSPQALSMGGRLPSATMTRRPRERAAMAAARPAGPPPMMKTSVSKVVAI